MTDLVLFIAAPVSVTPLTDNPGTPSKTNEAPEWSAEPASSVAKGEEARETEDEEDREGLTTFKNWGVPEVRDKPGTSCSYFVVVLGEVLTWSSLFISCVYQTYHSQRSPVVL